MEELTEKLQQLGINKIPSVNELTKLVVQHEKRKIRGKQLAATKPVNYEIIAKMMWAKDHKDLIEQFKISIGATPNVTNKIVKEQLKQKKIYVKCQSTISI